jgi:adenylate cyclase
MKLQPGQRAYGFGPLLAVLLLLILLSSMSLIAVVSSIFTRRSVRELSDRIVDQTLARVELRIDDLLARAMDQNAQERLLMAGRQLSMTDFKELGGFLAHSLDVQRDLSDLGFGLGQNGDYVFAERLLDDTVRVREYVNNDSGARVIRDWRWNGAQRELLQETPWDGYDPRKRPFYERAVAAGTNAWTETYQFWHRNEHGAIPGVTFASPLYDANGRLLGVLNADFDLAALCRFLGEVRKGMVGYAFVVERRGDGVLRLIAHPDPSALPASGTETNGLRNLPDRAVAAFEQAEMTNEAAHASSITKGTFTFVADGRTLFGSARELAQPPWTIGVIIPVQDVMGGVYRNDQWEFWIGLTCLTFSAFFAVRVARRVAEPLRQLTREAQAIGRLELDSKTGTVSRIEEVSLLANSMTEMKSSLRSFQKFVPADVVRDLVLSATEARLGGRRATLTLLFSDVADFTAMAERMEPEALVAHIGEYLGEMSEVIHARSGTLDKFIGDGIMAFWGAPRENPAHAREACAAAWQCQRALMRLRGKWRLMHRPELRARIGLHTGTVIVGNIGSENRLNYTAVGDSVNLTSRLEGLNRFYGTEILISAACLEAAGSAIVTRPVDNVSVKGRTEGLIVHELLGMADETGAEQRQLSEATTAAFAAYLRGDFADAHERYRALLAFQPDDPVAVVMEARCREFIGTPPPTDWNTTFRMKLK